MECKWRPTLFNPLNCLLNINLLLATQALTYSDSTDYVLRTNKNFDYTFYYTNFCDGYTREQTDNKLKNDIENSVYNYSSTVYGPTNWLSEQLNYSLPVSILSWMFIIETNPFLAHQNWPRRIILVNEGAKEGILFNKIRQLKLWERTITESLVKLKLFN